VLVGSWSAAGTVDPADAALFTTARSDLPSAQFAATTARIQGDQLVLALGKEWWVSDHWGLGVAGHISFSSNQDPVASNNTLTTWAFGAAFSATYN